MKKNNVIIKIIAISMSSLLLLTGCKKGILDYLKDEEPTTIRQELNDKDTSFSKDEKAIQAEFDEFLDDVYLDAMSYSLVSTHFDLHNPEDMGITEYDSIWGEDILDGYKDAESEDKAMLQELKAFNYNALTYDQQLIYDTLYKYLENGLILDKYFYFAAPFSPSSGAQFELNLILSEYAINDEDDVKDYIEVLKSCDEYIAELLEYESWRANQGYAMTDDAISDVIDQCNDILSAKEPAFLPVICEVIDECDFLTDDEKRTYKETIQTETSANFIPAYQNIITTLGSLRGLRSEEGGLCNYQGGSDYYEALIRMYTGSGKDMDTLIQTIDAHLAKTLLDYYNITVGDKDVLDKISNGLTYAKSEPTEILNYLMEMLASDFPTPVCTDYSLKYVAKSMESSSNPAFYLIPPYDNYTHNIIYVNNSEEYSSMDLFPLLAHEGMPGHMYQNNYFLSLNPHPIRTLLSFNGYAEGWAQYVENYSYRWAGLEESVADMMVADGDFGFALYSRVDIGVNYQGWDVDDIEEYLSNYLTDTSFAGELYETFINDPGIYLQYYVGYLEILELRDTAMEQLEDRFKIKDFHRFLLEIGPTYFDIIDERMSMWMKEQK
ncbi:MAG: DUF885 domain-containing protein [Lachnospiraceae bacterium]|nr:DUF885 domain-containing protein [Lachnospiraceae bacterium]